MSIDRGLRRGIVFAASAPFGTRRYGEFTISVARTAEGREHIVLVKGDVRRQSNVLCRVASKCVTSTALNADDCDCEAQLELAFGQIHRAGSGVILYMDEEGRGNGLVLKVRAMNGKKRGLDTFTAVEELGVPADRRDFHDAALILNDLEVDSICLLTSNPAKVEGLRAGNVDVVSVRPCRVAEPLPRAVRHLEAKRARGHDV